MRILLLSADKGDQAFFGAVGKSANMPLYVASSPAELCGELLKDPAAVVVVDATTQALYKSFETILSEKVGLYSSALNSNAMYALISKNLHDSGFLLKNDIFGHFVHRTYTDDDAPLVASLFRKSGQDRAFGLEQHFAPSAKVQTVVIKRSLEKRAVVESLKTNLLSLGFKARMATVICAAADELIMNAIFDAPMDETGRHVHSRTARSADLKLEGRAVVEMKIGFDGNLLGVSVTDQHGSLDKKKLLGQHMAKSYEKSEYETRSISAGAGLGLSQVYRNCSGVVFTCENAERTEVTVFFHKANSFKDFKDQFRFLSTFVYFS